ncbi:peptide ABC transporter permease [Lentzea sp. NBRC 105346]|uniref:ABC transporter permease n=1 Tax=Lentzea sp. NBRC 105346 TaxID=3032205 RepID=UPI0024A32972|nr:ABC transporter permease [Lentzea sp. NBRC 105346]GLZ28484.1 peptide ABC transporter permease [Lentzea sp. NBRC 105346]
MTKLVATRLAGMLLVLLTVAFCTFVVFYLVPSDPAQLACGRPCTEQNLALAREFMGLDESWWQQFLDFLTGIFAGRTFGTGATAIHCAAPCFGYSFQQNTDVVTLIADRVPVTFSLAFGAAAIWLVFGVGLGVLAALRKDTPIDRITLAGSVAGVSAPVYLVGLLGILLFGFTLDVVPVGGYVAFAESPLDWAWRLILPWCVLAFAHAAFYVRLVRSSMLETLNEDFIRTARAKGVRESTVVGKHALRNVLLPVVTLVGIDLGGLLGGAVITESVFSLPGLGGLLIDAVHQRDLPLVLGCTLFAGFLVVVANTLVDLCYGVLDPRARLT